MYQSVSAPDTIIAQLHRLMPGEYGTFKNGNFQKQYYWQIGQPSISAIKNDTDWGDIKQVHRTIRQLLTASVERRMISDVPLGAFLSGGIDSSAVVGLMAACSTSPVNTFSINFSEPDFDESRYSNLIARKFNTRHTPILLQPEDFLASLPEALAAMDSPSGDGFNSWLVAKKTKEAGITVALSGIGGDELFAGYASFSRWIRLNKHFIWKIPAAARQAGATVLGWSSDSQKSHRLSSLLRCPQPTIEAVYPFFRQILTAAEAARICSARQVVYADPLQDLLASRKTTLHQLPLLSQYSAAELLGYTANVLLKDTDQMSMAAALEVREPFFDYELIEYVLQVPDSIKYPRYPKSLLVESLVPLLPDEIVHRPKKGFTLPWKHWLRGELKSWCQTMVNNLADRQPFNGDAVRALSNQFYLNNHSDNWMQVFQMAVLEDWLERNHIQ
jgi:asparagine synthase (glutamine-hydrolysing)